MVMTRANQGLQQLFKKWKTDEVGLPDSHREGCSLNCYRRDIVEKWAITSSRPPRNSKFENTGVAEDRDEASFRQWGNWFKVCTQNHWISGSSISPSLCIVWGETLDLETPGSGESQGWKQGSTSLYIRNCGTPSLTEAMCIEFVCPLGWGSSWAQLLLAWWPVWSTEWTGQSSHIRQQATAFSFFS